MSAVVDKEATLRQHVERLTLEASELHARLAEAALVQQHGDAEQSLQRTLDMMRVPPPPPPPPILLLLAPLPLFPASLQACVRACVRACVKACVHARACANARGRVLACIARSCVCERAWACACVRARLLEGLIAGNMFWGTHEVHAQSGHPCHICAGTGPTAAASAPDWAHPLPHLHWD